MLLIYEPTGCTQLLSDATKELNVECMQCNGVGDR